MALLLTSPPTPAATPDVDLFRRFQAGDEDAMCAIVEQYHRRLIAFVALFVRSREVAEEVAQESFLMLYEDRVKVHSPEKLRPWLFVIAKRRALREVARKSWTSEVSFDPEDLREISPALDPQQQHGLLSVQLRRALDAALQQLDATERDLVTMRFYGGLQIRELSEALAMPMGTVGVKLQRALQKIRQQFEAQGIAMEDFLP